MTHIIFSIFFCIYSSISEASPLPLKKVGVLEGHRDDIISLSAFEANDGSPRATSLDSKGNVFFWDLKSRRSIWTKNIPELATSPTAVIVASPDHRLIAMSGLGSQVRVLNTSNGQILHTLKAEAMILGYVTALTFSNDSRLLAVVDFLGLTTIFETQTGRKLHTINVPGGLDQIISFSRDNSYLVVQSEAGVVFIRLAGDTVVGGWVGPEKDTPWISALSQDQRYVAVQSSKATDPSIRVIALESKREIKKIPLPAHGNGEPLSLYLYGPSLFVWTVGVVPPYPTFLDEIDVLSGSLKKSYEGPAWIDVVDPQKKYRKFMMAFHAKNRLILTVDQHLPRIQIWTWDYSGDIQ